MKFKLFISFTFTILFIFTNAYADNRNITILESNSEFLLLKFELGDYYINHSNNYTFINGSHLSFDYQEGEARLPVLSSIIGIPPEGNISFKAFNTKISKIPLENPIAPYPKYVQEIGEETCRMIYEIQPDIYYNSLSPRDIDLTEPYIWRNQRVVKLFIHPFRVENNQLIITSECRIRIEFKGNGHIKSEFKDKNFKNVFQNTIINFDVAKDWSIKTKRGIPDNPFSNYKWFKIPITQDGIYKITKSQLADFDIVDKDNLYAEYIRIFNGGGYSLNRNSYTGPTDLDTIPVFISDTDDGFPIYFYARDTNGSEMNPYYSSQYYNPYTGENIYWLTYNTDFGIKKNIPSKPKTTLQNRDPKETLNIYHYKEHFEEEKLRSDPIGIKWFWYNFSGTASNIKSFDFSVSNLIHNENQKIILKFNTSPSSNYINFKLNDEEITPSSSGGSKITFSGNFLQNGNNIFDIYYFGSKSLYFDYYNIEYDKNLSLENNRVAFSLPDTSTTYNIEVSNVQNNDFQIFKVYDFNRVVKIEDFDYENETVKFDDSISNKNTRYFVVLPEGGLSPNEIIEDELSDLRSNLEPTDIIIITPDEFYEKSQELAIHHEEFDGLLTRVVKLTDIYDEFSWGLEDVVGIRYFLHYAFDYYGEGTQNQPAYVILIGDGTNDFRKYEAITGNKNKIPPFINSNKALDENYVYFSSSSSNDPEMMIGRIPCQTQTELEIVIDKIVNYTTNPNYGFWRSSVMISADDFLWDGHHQETINTSNAESLSTLIENNVELIKIYGIDYPLDEFRNRPEVTEAIIKTVNNGVAIFVYLGHGGYDVLGHEDYFRGSRDISRLTNSDMLTFFYAGSCNVGHFDSNTFESMAEKILLAKDRGAIASYASSRGGGYGDYENIIKKLVNKADEERRIGEAIFGSNSYQMYNLFGDPAIRLVIPPIAGNLKIVENHTDSLKARETANIIGNINDPDNQYEQIFAVVYDTDYPKSYPYEYKDEDGVWVWGYKEFTTKGKPIFKGPISCSQDSFSLHFIVPDDIYGSSKGHILAYAVNTDRSKDILMSYNKQSNPNNHNLIINGYSDAINDGPPTINIWLDRKEFENEDFVSATPTLFAEVSDSNGINITNCPGHRILLTIDDDFDENITDKFVYDIDSYTNGTIEHTISNLSPGYHQLKLALFDNFNAGAFQEVSFNIKEGSKIKVYNVLNYPNPMKDFTHFTFHLDGDAKVDIEIFTISGKLIKKINFPEGRAGFNQIYWDGTDNDGDYPASGVYFYKIILNSKRIDNIYKLIISH
ncbi:MAG: type IX secretion system sortase PorU [Candidatus Cloacimonetes bacterium]|nr:type IX secretion system sortase PorU [Candidatus Cloacimonadota bacterium]